MSMTEHLVPGSVTLPPPAEMLYVQIEGGHPPLEITHY